MEDMAEPIVDFEHEGKTYTLMKFVQVGERSIPSGFVSS